MARHECNEDFNGSSCVVGEYIQRLQAIGFIAIHPCPSMHLLSMVRNPSYDREISQLQENMISWDPRTSFYDLLFMRRHNL